MSLTPIVFLLIFITGLVAAILDASFGILVYVTNYFVNPQNRWWWDQVPDIRYAFIISIVTMAAYVLRIKEYTGNKVFDAPQTKWFIFFYLIMLGTWPVAVSQVYQEIYLTLVIKYLVLYLLIIKTVDTPKKFERLIGFFLAGQFYLGWIVYEVGRTSGGGRVEGMGTTDARDSNGLAALMVTSVSFLIHYLITGKKWQKCCALPMLVFILNALILVNSRISLIALMVSMAYYLFLSLTTPSFTVMNFSLIQVKSAMPKLSKLTVIAGVVLAVCAFFYLADNLFWVRMETIVDPTTGATDSGRGRFVYWKATFDMLDDHPFGAGAFGYEFLSPDYLHKEDLSVSSGTRAVHSMYFEVLAEYGYHGFIVFMIFLLSIFRYLKRTRKTLTQNEFYTHYHMNIALESSLVAFLVAGLTQNRLYAEVFYWLAAFIAAHGNICLKEIKKLDNDFSQKQVTV